MKQLEAVLFDFDGTLVNSEWLHYDCWNEILKPYHVRISEQEYEDKFAGIPTSRNAQDVIDRHNLPLTVRELVDLREEEVQRQMLVRDVELMPYAADMVAFFYERKIPMAIVTGSPRRDVDRSIAKLGWEHYFEFYVTFDDVVHSKPNPESYLKAVDKLGLEKDNLIVFEDTESGSRSAKDAGLYCLGIQANKQYHPRLAHTDRIFVNMDEAKASLLGGDLGFTL